PRSRLTNRKLLLSPSGANFSFGGSVYLKDAMKESANRRKPGKNRMCFTKRSTTPHDRSIEPNGA
ncbi:MAG: hypothetical protein OXN84_06235, partial [Albidovulum sp.]|nr:hypothetical protein [Albidovulum sp.]